MLELQTTTEKHLEDLENEKSCTAKLTLEIEELRTKREELDGTEARHLAEIAELRTKLEESDGTEASHLAEIAELLTKLEKLDGTEARHLAEVEVLRTKLEKLDGTEACHLAEIEELRTKLEKLDGTEARHLAELHALTHKHLEDLENEKSCTAKLTLEVEELRNHLEDAVESKKKLCHELEVHNNERQAEEQRIISMKKHVIGLAVNEKALIMDLDREFQRQEKLHSQFECEAKSYIQSLQTKLDQCLIDLSAERDATARAILDRNELKDSYEILLNKQNIVVDKAAEVENTTLRKRLSELEKEVEFQKQRMQADRNERLAIAQKEFDNILSEQSARNAIENQNSLCALQQLLDEANAQICELKAHETASTLDASQLKEDMK